MRQKALSWWCSMFPKEREKIAARHFPHMPLVAVDRSTSMILRIYQREDPDDRFWWELLCDGSVPKEF